jgi:hypothetical protein
MIDHPDPASRSRTPSSSQAAFAGYGAVLLGGGLPGMGLRDRVVDVAGLQVHTRAERRTEAAARHDHPNGRTSTIAPPPRT